MSDPFVMQNRVTLCWANQDTPQACRSDAQYEVLTNYSDEGTEPGREMWAGYCPRHLTLGLRTWCLASGTKEVRARLAWGLRVHLEVNPGAREDLRLPNGKVVEHSRVAECQHRDEHGQRDCPKPAKDGNLCDGHRYEETLQLERIRQIALAERYGVASVVEDYGLTQRYVPPRRRRTNGVPPRRDRPPMEGPPQS